VRIRRADAADCAALSDLALRSKAHWGYDAKFLEACRAELTVHPSDVQRSRVIVAEESGELLGFYVLAGEPPQGELTFLFVDPARIGTGVGRALWRCCMTSAARAGLSRVRIESDPFAEGFYAAMGAKRVGEAPSQSIPDRMLPLMTVEIGALPVELHPIHELASEVARVLEDAEGELQSLVPGIELHHIGATSMPDGLTKGDVDVNLRLPPDRFEQVVAALSTRFDIAQPQNWTSTYASFSDDGMLLPLGIQVTVEGSDDDFLVSLRDELRDDAALRRRYEQIKREAAPAGRDAYWFAKDNFLRGILREQEQRGNDGASAR
jgi:GrpB-like predicted nucleotidyltransferase (UPF0157 family)/N-acetylglutamate synthase-like GNAT family acetyltransferase